MPNQEGFTHLEISKSTNKLVSASFMGEIIAWDVTNGKKQYILKSVSREFVDFLSHNLIFKLCV